MLEIQLFTVDDLQRILRHPRRRIVYALRGVRPVGRLGRADVYSADQLEAIKARLRQIRPQMATFAQDIAEVRS